MRLPFPRLGRLRAERFGGVVELIRPQGLLHVDRAMMRSLGVASSPLWRGADEDADAQLSAGPLSAPTEVHVVLSRRCSAGCTGCYVGATPQGAVLPLEAGRRILDTLAAQGVFHVALGGGEALDLPHLFELAAYARSVGITPNLTTNGFAIDEVLAARCAIFGQINVSVDGVGEAYRAARGVDGYARAERALRLLRAVRREVGVNCVVSRQTYDGLGEVAALVRRLGLSELELLRFKPVGRGAARDAELTDAQARGLYPLVRRLALRHRVRVKLDCSFAPMVFFHRPSSAAASFFGVQGCVAGDVLAAVTPEGMLTGCSFARQPEADLASRPDSFATAWSTGFGVFRTFVERAPEPCRSCDYLALCRGGCRAVAQAHGEAQAPDPGCPVVLEHAATVVRGHAAAVVRGHDSPPAQVHLPVLPA